MRPFLDFIYYLHKKKNPNIITIDIQCKLLFDEETWRKY